MRSPSTNSLLFALICSTVSPLPSRYPKLKLRLSGLMAVAIKSPIPAVPINALESDPITFPKAIISARPLVMTNACIFRPKSLPANMPESIAIIFLSAPASSVPTISLETKTRNWSEESNNLASSATSSYRLAINVPAGFPANISDARLGPEIQPILTTELS